MKKLGLVAFGLFAVSIFCFTGFAQKRWTYEADNGKQGNEREEVTITITQKQNGYEVSGEYRAQDADILEGRVACPIRGQYFATTSRLRARAICGKVAMKPDADAFPEEMLIDGLRVSADQLQVTLANWTANAWLDGKRKEPAKEQEPRYVGCFKDSNDPFAMGNPPAYRSPENTPKLCIQTCKERKFKYAGVQFGESCLCGDTPGAEGASNCDMDCTGDKSQKCGGRYANSVYETGLP